ncbi:uncharacterized protein F4812DRAFT_459719 [Daldinia caldariorum]|uniref:uncharacterized protein n=1 Tax=Daldinia caldariorum TaxID=326644 RepID=UPI00200859EF|nr:uncharacterized protein F4812DRAFT_459719 [Daldinia caldariorum]KAI1467615.1 hypothetical protein F4812DRAFT_459719 [Daldinia caldariorum]
MSSPEPQETESQKDSSEIQVGTPDASAAPPGLEGPSTPTTSTQQSQSSGRGPPSDSSSSTPTGPVRINPVTPGPSTSGTSAPLSFSRARFPAWTSRPVTSNISAVRHRGPPVRQRPNLLRPGIDFPVFDTGVNESGPHSSSQPSSAPSRPVIHIDGTVGPTERPDHSSECTCELCCSYFHHSNYFLRGTHDPTGRPLPSYASDIESPIRSTAAPDLAGRAALRASRRQAEGHATAARSRRNAAPSQATQVQQPPFQPTVGYSPIPGRSYYYGPEWYPPYAAIYPVYAAGQGPNPGLPRSATLGGLQVPTPHVGQQAFQAPQQPQETQEGRESREREERIRRYREQHERAISFSELDDEEFIPNIKNP